MKKLNILLFVLALLVAVPTVMSAQIVGLQLFSGISVEGNPYEGMIKVKDDCGKYGFFETMKGKLIPFL